MVETALLAGSTLHLGNDGISSAPAHNHHALVGLNPTLGVSRCIDCDFFLFSLSWLCWERPLPGVRMERVFSMIRIKRVIKTRHRRKPRAMTATASTGGHRPIGFTRSMTTRPAKPSRALSARRTARRWPQPTRPRRARPTKLLPARTPQPRPSPKLDRLGRPGGKTLRREKQAQPRAARKQCGMTALRNSRKRPAAWLARETVRKQPLTHPEKREFSDGRFLARAQTSRRGVLI